MRRRFTKRERWAAWIIQDGRSARSGEPLGSEFHADHRDPWSKGGATSIENCDALTPTENLAKGDRMKNRFAWQDEFIEKWLSWTEQNFFLCALPGAGKTRATRRVARLWIEQGGVPVIVGPTNPIKRNWRTEFQHDGLMLDANFYGFLRAGYHGVVTNYQAVNGQSLAFRKLCHDHPVLLICDEIHHASENELSTWGTDLRGAFELAQRRLLLSGTPVRSDRETTSFLAIEPYDDDGVTKHRYKMDFEYDWPRALADGVVRTLIFPRVKMDSVNVDFKTKGRQTFSIDDDQYLTYALDDRRMVLSVLREANEKLTELRKADATAGALAVAKNIWHAKMIVELLETLGEQPVIVTSAEDDDSADVIDEFRESTKRWLVSVRQVAEGVDIQRLRVLAYLTNYVTDLAFRQFVGRVARRREHETDDSAHGFVFIPECKSLIALAEIIESMQELALKKEGRGGTGGGKGEFGITVDGTKPEFIGYVIHGRHFVGSEAEVIRQLMKAYRITEESASLILNDPEFARGVKVGESPEQHEFVEEPIWVQEDLLKADCNDLAGKLTNIRIKNLGEIYTPQLYGRMIAQVHTEFMIDSTKQEQLSVPQLQRKKEQLRRAIFREG
jgi:superfamily II DNA or RNA helicase